MQALAITGLAFFVSSTFVVLLKPLCVRLGHVDQPGGRKRHGLATPLSGGLAIAVSIVLLGMGLFPSFQVLGFAFGICLLLILGAWDDRNHVPASLRLLIQVIAVGVGMCALGDVRLSSLGNLLGLGDIELGAWSTLFTVFAAVGVINAVNMIDGVDGLAGGFAVLVIGVLLTLTAGTGAVSDVLLYVTIGSVIGFLVFNLRTPWQRQARIFLGDAGSLVLGYVLVWFAIQGTQGYIAIMKPITAVWLFGLPLCDTIYLMGSRLLRRKSPMHADRFHFHHFLLRAGLSPGWTLYAWLLTAAAFIGIGIAGDYAGVSEGLMFAGFLLAFLCYCGLMTAAWRGMLSSRSMRGRSIRG